VAHSEAASARRKKLAASAGFGARTELARRPTNVGVFERFTEWRREFFTRVDLAVGEDRNEVEGGSAPKAGAASRGQFAARMANHAEQVVFFVKNRPFLSHFVQLFVKFTERRSFERLQRKASTYFGQSIESESIRLV